MAAMDDGAAGGSAPGRGIRVDDLPDVMRELFLQAVADARASADPFVDFDEFVEALWAQTSLLSD